MADSSLSTTFPDEFDSLGQLPAASKPEGFTKLLDKIFKASSPETLEDNLKAYLAYLLGSPVNINGITQPQEPLSIIAARPLLSAYISRLSSISSLEQQISIANTALSLLHPRVFSFEEQDSALKYLLADAHQKQEDFLDAARILQSINLDTSQRTITDADKADLWVRVARCYLEEDDHTSAMSYINRAKNVLHNVNDKAVQLQFKMSQARILDAQRSFLDASAAYHNISFEPVVDEEDRLQTLSAAIVCAVLAPAGPQRSRMLARLFKDDRTSQVEEYAILEKIFLDHLLTPDEVTTFAAKVPPHHLAKTSDGSTVLDRAVLQHNLLAASKLYRNITIESLGSLLGVDGDRAEHAAANMIEQGRLAGHIDQIDRLIFFEGEGSGEKVKVGAQQGNALGSMELRKWDAKVVALAEEVEHVTTMVQTQYPEFYAEHMAY